jgi:glucokinase
LSILPYLMVEFGIAKPGPFDYQTGIALMNGQDKFDELYGLNVKTQLSEALNINAGRIQFMNDAECFIRGEAFSGAAQGYNSIIGLTLGTSLGSSIYENGNSKDAELWCSPFKDGIAEDEQNTGTWEWTIIFNPTII